ncbi:tyrosine-type recombinase/integrase [Halobacillus litoralis]|uniref:tyrosine-type recombinase/integrase n=1 Tax=Halobacillus litoralis TaxID=45668 RepID=UPI00136DB7AF
MKKNKFMGKKQVMQRSRMIPTDSESYSLEKVHNLFVTAKKAEGLRERTIKDYEAHFGYFLTWLGENDLAQLSITDLTIDIIRGYVTYMQEKPLSPVTINIRIRTLRSFLRFIYEEQYYNENLANRVKIMKTDEDTLKIMSDEQIAAILNAIDKRSYTGFRDYVAIALMIDTGMRISEVGSLTKEQVDFEQRYIHLPSDKVKNRKGRYVPISPKVNKALYQLIAENSSVFNVSEVFLSVYGTPFQPGSFRKRLITYRDKAGVKGVRVSPHSFRHYFAKNYILNGGDPFTLQLILGHSDMQIVRRYIQMNRTEVQAKHHQFSPFQRF